jgi:SpoVK/Ycf46/Vps4 family AAA+-type ATPase
VGPDVEIDDLVKQTDGYSGHDIMNICKEAAHMPLRRRIDEQGGYQNITDYEKLKEEVNRPLNRDDFIVALKRTNKSVGTADLAKYEVFKKEFGCN